MGKVTTVVTLAVVLGLTQVPATAQASPDLIDALFGLKVCQGLYALCAASLCTPTEGTITVNVAGGGTAQFPAASCVCPLFNGPALADVNGGNMQGSCDPPGPGQVWSLYAPKENIPQQINNWSQDPDKTKVSIQLCSSSEQVGATFANCFSFACKVDRHLTNGVSTATCTCPLGEGPDGKPVDPSTPVLTPAGQCNSVYCSQHPVGVPYGPADDQPNKCLGVLTERLWPGGAGMRDNCQ